MYLSRRQFVQYAAVTGLAAPLSAGRLAAESLPPGQAPGKPYAPPPAFALEEITIQQLQDGLKTGKYTSRRLVSAYLTRIQQIDGQGPTLRSVIETNPDALALADAADAERKAGKVRGPLHGIPVLIKDNIATGDKMQTTAGSLALADAPAPHDSAVAQRLRDAGAIIIGKTNLSEWANFRSTHSVSGWSGRGGLVKNPYALDRNACGSSSGTGAAISANLAAVGVGSETDGSIVCPSSANSLVGIKPTLGLVSRRGIIPISHTQDTAGPMARTVADAAALLGVLAGVDAGDAATAAAGGHIEPDYTKFLDPNGLKGARIGVARTKFFGYSGVTDKLVQAAIDAMKQAGAVIVDPADIPHAGEYDDAEFTVLLYEFKADLNAYLAGLGAQASNKTLADLIAWNDKNHDRELAYFGQEIFTMAQDKGPLTDDAYIEALAHCRRLSRTEGLDVVFAKEKLDALVAPTGSPAWTTDLVNGDHFLGASSTPAAVSGYPSISVPVGYVRGLPVGMSFIGTAWSEPTLIRLAYAYEQAVKPRRAPRLLPTADLSAP
ncbi:MAG TPA: amidase [Gemmatimonadales bacterium]|nr:amidase [Gemmatimonadales bacterium]